MAPDSPTTVQRLRPSGAPSAVVDRLMRWLVPGTHRSRTTGGRPGLPLEADRPPAGPEPEEAARREGLSGVHLTVAGSA